MKEWDYVKLVFRTGDILRFGECKIASVDFADNYVIICGGECVYYNKNDVLYMSCTNMEETEGE